MLGQLRVLCAHQQAKCQADQDEDNSAEKCRPESSNAEAGNKGAGEQQDDGIDDEEEQAQGEDAQRERQQFEQEAEGYVQKSYHDGSDQGVAQSGELKTGNDVGDDQQR